MVALNTPEVNIDWPACDFSLTGTDGKKYSLSDVKGENGLVVMFICNHCPFVQAIIDKIIRDMQELRLLGIGSVAIMSNDSAEYADDSFENMRQLAIDKKFPFPYLIDETQEIAKEYGAVCTPDFFGFNADLKLQYRGRLDDSGMNNKPDASRDLFMAMSQIAKTGHGPATGKSSIGCSIKWKSIT